MSIRFLKVTAVFIFLVLSELVMAQGSGVILANVNGTKIYSSQVNDWVASVVASGGKDTPELRQTMLNDLIAREVILQDAKKTGLSNKGNNALKIRLAEQNTILELWFAQYAKDHPISDADIKAQYDQQAQITKDPRNSKEYQLSQIVLASESDAMAVIKQINGGTSFDQLAREKSIDKPSALQGGLIGWVLPGKLTPPLDVVIPGLSKGRIDPKPMQVGNLWYVIKVDDIRNYTFQSFEQAKPAISQALLQRQKQDAINGLLKSAKISIGSKSSK